MTSETIKDTVLARGGGCGPGQSCGCGFYWPRPGSRVAEIESGDDIAERVLPRETAQVADGRS